MDTSLDEKLFALTRSTQNFDHTCSFFTKFVHFYSSVVLLNWGYPQVFNPGHLWLLKAMISTSVQVMGLIVNNQPSTRSNLSYYKTFLLFLLSGLPGSLAYTTSWSATPFNTQSIPLHVKNPCNSIWAPQSDSAVPSNLAWPRLWDQSLDVCLIAILSTFLY